ncbi:ferredoxin [Streptomyces sp. NBC_01506]|uniref:ferredoxin n=1 Tax=Streptomyces sp. NBC_01506 TaxID=2903887 RepID=UPI00386C94AB
MRITTDIDKCVGAGQCAYSAPAFFDQDEYGIVTVLDRSPDLDRFHLVRAAVDQCPSGALTLVEDPAEG